MLWDGLAAVMRHQVLCHLHRTVWITHILGCSALKVRLSLDAGLSPTLLAVRASNAKELLAFLIGIVVLECQISLADSALDN